MVIGTEDKSPLEPAYPLSVALERFFPGGYWTVATLRTAIRNGDLVAERIGGRLAVTESAVQEWRERCRQASRPPERERVPFSSSHPAVARDAARYALKQIREQSREAARLEREAERLELEKLGAQTRKPRVAKRKLAPGGS